MNKQKTKVCAFLLAMLMLIGTLPLNVFAETSKEGANTKKRTFTLKTEQFDFSDQFKNDIDFNATYSDEGEREVALLLFGLLKDKDHEDQNLVVPIASKSESTSDSFALLEREKFTTSDGKTAYCLDPGKTSPNGKDFTYDAGNYFGDSKNTDSKDPIKDDVVRLLSIGYPNVKKYKDLTENEWHYATSLALKLLRGTYYDNGVKKDGLNKGNLDDKDIVGAHNLMDVQVGEQPSDKRMAVELINGEHKNLLDDRADRILDAVKYLLDNEKDVKLKKVHLEDLSISRPEGIDKNLIGPFKATQEGMQNPKLDIKSHVVGRENAKIELVDKDGKTIVPNFGEKFFIKTDIEDGEFKVEIEAYAVGEKALTNVYYTLDDTHQRMYVCDTTDVSDGLLVDAKAEKPEKPVDQTVISKRDAVENGNPVAGAEIEIKDPNGKVVFEGKTPENGDITIDTSKWVSGTYTFEETAVPEGYKAVPNSEKGTFEIKDGKVVKTAILINEKIVPEDEQVVISKRDAVENGKPVAGATIQIFNPAGELIFTEVTPENGDITLDVSKLDNGTYKIKETEAPNGYILNSTEGEFVIEDHKVTKKAVLVNEKIVPGTVTISKTDLVDGTPVPGATIEVFKIVKDENGKTTEQPVNGSPFKTDENGKITITELEAGDYKFKETVAPDGYVTNETSCKFSVDQHGQVKGKTTLTNKKMNDKIVIKKVDANTDRSLAGAVFEITDKNDKKISDNNFTTNDEGVIVLKNLKAGKYNVKEVKAPVGYQLDDKVYTLEVDKEGNAVEDLVLKNKPTELIINKTDNEGKALANAEFEIKDKNGNIVNTENRISNKDGKIVVPYLAEGTYTVKEVKAPAGYILNDKTFEATILPDGKLEKELTIKNTPLKDRLTKVDATTKKALEGAEFTFYDQNNNPVGTRTSNKDGHIFLDNLAVGNYTYKETKTPVGYNVSDKVYKVSIMGDGTLTGELIVENEPTVVNLTKVDQNGKGLAGAVIEIKNSEGKVVAEIKSDAEGKIAITGLAPGEYVAVEKEAPAGFILSDKEYKFSVDAKGAVLGDTKLENKEIVVELLKVNEKGEKLEGAEFEIRNSDDKVLARAKTNKDGKITIRRIPVGEYKLIETKAPEGYVLADKDFKFTVEKDGKATGDLKIENVRAEIALKKLDKDTNKELTGAKFEVRNGKSVVTKVESDRHGNIVINGLKPGDYTLVETEAPEGYLVGDKAFKFTVDKDGKLKGSDKVYNQKAEIKLIKKDLTTGAVLEGASFTVKDSDGKVVSNVTTNKNGEAKIQGLGTGKYVLEETKAPDGYVKPDKEVSFEVDKNGKVGGKDYIEVFNKSVGKKVEKPNENKPEEKPIENKAETPIEGAVVPTPQQPVEGTTPTPVGGTPAPEKVKTGDDTKSVTPFLIGGAVVMLGALIFVSKHDKKDKK